MGNRGAFVEYILHKKEQTRLYVSKISRGARQSWIYVLNEIADIEEKDIKEVASKSQFDQSDYQFIGRLISLLQLELKTLAELLVGECSRAKCALYRAVSPYIYPIHSHVALMDVITRG